MSYPVRCYPERKGYLSACVLLFAMGILLIALYYLTRTPQNQKDELIVWLFSVAVAFYGIVGAIWCLRSDLEATETGIAWPNGFAAWEDIIDYYQTLPHKHNKTCFFTIELRSGRKLRFTRDWSHQEAFRAAVAAKATGARCTEWGVKEARLTDVLSRALDYHTFENRMSFLMSWLPVLALPLLIGSKSLSELPRSASVVGWNQAILINVLPLFTISLVVIPFIPFSLAIHQDIKRRLHDSIVITKDGLLFANEETRIPALWSDILDYYIERQKDRIVPQFVVATTNGTFTFSRYLRDANLLTTAIRQNHPDRLDWAFRGDDESLSSVPQVTNGVQTFDFKTRTNRIFLLALAAFPFMLMLVAGLRAILNLDSFKIDAVAMLILIFPLIYFLWRYHAARVVLTDEGITHHTTFGNRFLAWSEITSIGQTAEESLTITIRGNARTLHIIGTIAHADLLIKTIQNKAIRLQDNIDNEKMILMSQDVLKNTNSAIEKKDVAVNGSMQV